MANESNVEALKQGLPQAVFAKGTDQIRVRTDRYRQIYANNMTISLSTWDVAITFGEIVGEQEGKPVIEETTKILMTREIAKVLSALLTTHVDLFEKNFWEIKLPVGEVEVSADKQPKVEARKKAE